MDVPIPVRLQILVIVSALLWSSCRGQQAYLESDLQGYNCSSASPCSAYATYRAVQGDTLVSVGLRFGLSGEQVAQTSQVPTGSNLTPGQLLLIPLNCSCASGRSQYNVSYVIQKGDTFYLVSNNTFQGLTTYQAVERANPTLEPTKLEPGDKVTFPIRCACPTSQQIAGGIKSLVTYSILPDDSLEKIASDWNVSRSSVANENIASGAAVANDDLQAFTTLLLPVTQDPPQPPKQAASPPSSNAPPPQVPTNGGGSPPSSSSSSSKTAAYVGIGVGCAAALGILVLGGVFYRKKTRKLKKTSRRDPSKASYGTTGSIVKDEEREFGTFSSSMSSGVFMNNSKEHQNDILVAGMNDLVDSEKPVLFSYEELRDATNNFSPSHLIQGSMYRGVLRKQLVAIKEMKGGTTSQELKILCKVHHSNLVKLVGVCSGADHLFLVYEYAENGSLSSCLHNKTPADFKLAERPASDSAASSSAFLSWNARMQIALDVATGLEYIHDYTKPSFVHKDIKSSNILLDYNLRAKVANFGMARLTNDTALTKHIAGTQGYMAPEYLTHGFVTTKVDVYAFGVVLLELLTGREAILGSGANPDKQYLADVFVKLVDDFSEDNEQKIEKLKPWVDPVLENAFPWDPVLSFVALARSCVDPDPDARPNMKELTYKLSKLLDSCMEWETAAVLNRRYNNAPLEGR